MKLVSTFQVDPCFEFLNYGKGSATWAGVASSFEPTQVRSVALGEKISHLMGDLDSQAIWKHVR